MAQVTRLRVGLVVAAMLAAGPAAAQFWPNGSGPGQDLLRNTMEQYQRLAPPPVEAEQFAALPAPSSVEVGTPVLALPDEPVRSGVVRGGLSAPRRDARRTIRTTGRTTGRTEGRREATRRPRSVDTARGTDGSRLERDIAARERRIEELQRQIEADRARLAPRGGGLSSLNPIPPAAAATLPPPPTATMR